METKENNEDCKTWETWDEMLPLPTTVVRGIYAHGFDKPSPIQQKAIVPMLTSVKITKDDKTFERRPDMIVQAQSGTGKTGCFSVGALSVVDPELDKTQVIVLCHTHELAAQILEVMKSIGAYTGIRILKVVGGSPVEADKRKLDGSTPHIIIATPGRVHDLIRRKYINTDSIGLVIVDEADEMLTEGFKDQLYNIFKFMPNMVQITLFSATMPAELKELTLFFLEKPVCIYVKAAALTLQGITQWKIYLENDEHKYRTLKDIYQGAAGLSQTIIYCNSTKRVDDLHEALVTDGFPASKIHGKMEDYERKAVDADFRAGKARTLVTSDLFARGVDIQQVGVVINFDVPKSEHTYIHRIGRSGRFGRKGYAINFASKQDAVKLQSFEVIYDTQIDEFPSNWKDKIN
mgnify:CR=1 FL=1|tara:strand:+ start:3387 stop:4601 length:1215 start_codon:yes stop_codon:yes gene_type:complete